MENAKQKAIEVAYGEKYKNNCDCQDFENGLISNYCEVHNENPYPNLDNETLYINKKMEKEKVIQKAYGEYWEIFSNETIKRILQNNGSVDYFLLTSKEKDDTEKIRDLRLLECTKTDEGTKRFFRPKSLSGIETNNNWISINSENDLPKENGHYLVFDKQRNIVDIDYINSDYDSHSERWMEFNSHYQPINKPEKPIY